MIYIDCHAVLYGSKPKKKQLQLQRTINISCHDHIKTCYFTVIYASKGVPTVKCLSGIYKIRVATEELTNRCCIAYVAI